MSARPLALVLALMTVLLLAAGACSGIRAQARSSGGGGGKDCKSCERMCEVAGDAQKNPGAVDKCKADCAKKCE
jgi:hypothetical protein